MSGREEGAWVATMSTESFTFTAVGRSKAEAERAVAAKFHELATEHMSIPQLKEWYGLNARFLAFGAADRE